MLHSTVSLDRREDIQLVLAAFISDAIIKWIREKEGSAFLAEYHPKENAYSAKMAQGSCFGNQLNNALPDS